MTDNGKKYLINVGDEAEMWTSDMYAEKGDKLFSSFSDAQVFEVEEAADFDEDPTDHQYIINVGDESEVWDGDMVKEKGAKLKEAYPDVRIQRVSYKDYWGEQATANREQRALLAQPDQERNAKLADLGYYDDITGEAFSYTQSEEGIPQWGPSIGLQPLSSIVGENEDGTTSYADPKVAEFFASDTSYTDRQAEIARLDAEYESNPSVIAQREYEAQWRADQAKYIDNQLAEIRDAITTEVDTIEAGKGAFYKTASTQGLGEAAIIQQAMDFMKGKDAGKALVENEKMETYASAVKLFEKAKQANEVAGKGFWGATGDVAENKFMDLVTQSDIEAYNEIGDILSRLEAKIGTLDGKELTDEVIESNLSKEEQALIRGFFAYNEAMANAGQNMSKAYKGGKIFGESISFMLEFLATGGLAGGTGKAASNVVGRSLVRWAQKAAKGTAKRAFRTGATKALKGLSSALVGTAARTVATPGTYKRAAEESVKIEDGHLDRTKNVFKSFADSYIENLSEISGGLIGKSLGLLGKGIGKAASMSGIPFSKLGSLLADNRLMQTITAGWKSVAPKFEALGFHGIFEEVGEEYIGNAIREFTIQPGALAEMHKDDNFGAMLIGFAPMTLFGGAMSAVSIGAKNIEAANLGKKLRETLGQHYSEEQIDHMMNLVSGAENSKDVWEAIKPLAVGLNAEETQQLFQYGAFMAQNKAMLFAKKAQDDNLAQAKRAELQQTYNKFWQENAEGVESVQLASLNDGRTVFVVSEPTADGVVSIIDASTGAKGFTNVSNYKTEEVDGAAVPMTGTWSMDAYLESEIASERRTAEGARMEREYNEQVQNLQSQIQEGTKINLGTEGNPVIMLATGKFVKDGVVAVDQAGNTHTIGWNQVADAMNQPIRVKTDQQLIDEEMAAIVARNAERRKKMTDADPAMTDAVNESAVQSAEVVAQENRHIPMNEDGTVNEAAFWEQDPEGYVQWNDEQNQDGGADSLQQVAITKAVLTSLLAEAQQAQQTSNPAERKAAKQRAQEIAEKINRLTAIEAGYAEQRIAPLRERAMKWKSLTNAPVYIVETEEDLASISGQAAASNKGGARVRGFAKDGRAYIYLPGIVEESEIDAVFMHEAVAHTGLKGLLGQQAFDELCDQVWEMMSPEMQTVFINYPGVNGNTRAAADEYIAHLAETMGAGIAEAEEKTIWQSIIDFVRNILRSMGIALNVSESELSDLIHMAYADLAKNMAEAEDIAVQQQEARTAEREAPSAARQEYDTYAEDLTHDEIKAVAANDFNAAQEAYNALVGAAPKVEMGESAKDFIARKKAYNEQVAEAKATLDARQALMDEIARIDAANAPVLTDAEVLEQEMMFSAKLTDREIDNLVEAMKANAEVAEVIALTPENWEAQFGAEGIIETPVGEVKMGPNQVTKLFSRNREEYFGMIKPTLTRPDVVVEKFAPAEDAERDTKYVFIKSFVKPDGSRIIHFESVTVQKEGREVSVSSHEAKEKDIKKEMQNGKLLHLNGMLSLSSEGSLTEAPIQERPDLVPTSNNVTSGSKDSENLETPSESERFSVSAVRIDPDANQQAEGNVMFSTRRGSLVGMHNISEEKLRKLIKQGGSANPSTAVIDIERQSFNSYGDISLIMPSSLVDAETGRNAGTFTADAWTPTYPQIEKRFSDDNLQRAYWRDITAIPEEMQHEVRMAFDSWLDNRTASGLAYMYLLERGEAPEMVRVAAKYPQEIKDEMSAILGEGRTGIYELTDEEKQAVLDLYIQENFGGSREDFDSSIAETIQRIEDRLSTGKVPSFVEKRITADLQWMKEHGYNYDNLSDFVRDIVSDIRHAGEVNAAATTNRALDYIKDNNLSAEYEQWKESLNDRYGIKEYLFGGYTPSGNPRWLPNTVENASKLMNKQGLAGATGMASSFNRFVATLAPKKKSLSDISSSKELLVEDEKLVDDFREKWSEVFFDLGIKCQPDAKGYEDYGLERLTEAAQKKNPGAYLKKEYGIELSQEDLQRLADMIKAIKTEFPARYFETKFQRPVYLNEFAAAVMPTTTSADIKQAIAEAGLPIFEYDSTIDGARREATLKATDIEGVRFSVRESSMDEIDSLFHDYNGDKSLEPLYDKVSALAHTMGLKIKFDNPWSNAAGTTVADKVKFNSMFMDSPYQPAEKKAHAILHELIHATTQYAIQAKKAGLLTEDMTEAVNQLDNIYNEIKADPAFEGMKGVESVHEMVAELANPEFRATLKEKNLFRQIVDAIKRLLGIETGENALDNLSSTLDYILENFDADAYRKYVDVAQRNEGYIRFSIANENQAIFVSNAARAVDAIKMEKATPEQWLKMIEKNGGLKAGEDKWMGLSDWLKASDKKTLTKQEVLDFINENMIIIEEEHYGESDLSALQEEFNEIYDGIIDNVGNEEEEDLQLWEVVMNPMERAWEELRERHSGGDDFDMAFSYDSHGNIEINDPDAAGYFLGVKPINDIRLDYTTSGLQNKQEIALVIPAIEPWNERDEVHFGDAGDGRAVAWIRFGETKKLLGTTEVDGKKKFNWAKVLVIDEIQSKRHQEGRENGYRVHDIEQWLKDNNVDVVESGEFYEFIKNGETDRRFSKGLMNYDIEKVKRLYVSGYNKSYIPDAPFDKNWHELAMKRMLRYAAENGYDVIAWTKGDQQAERYNIGDVVGNVDYRLNDDGSYHVDTMSKLGYQIESIPTAFNSEQELADIFGKEIARKIADNLEENKKIIAEAIQEKKDIRDWRRSNGIDQDSPEYKDVLKKYAAADEKLSRAFKGYTLSESDFRIGGEGMKGFYDKMLPAFMNKYGKKWGIKVEDIALPGLEDGKLTMHSVPVTEEMKASVMEGQVMFSAVQIDPAVSQEMDTIKAKAMWNGTFMKAPNGADTKLTEDQWLMVRTKNFINWFGDWENDPENASKVVDENGEPMVMYHGSAWHPLTEPKGNAVFRMRTGLLGRGAYFASSIAEATMYAEMATDIDVAIEGNYEILQDEYVTDYFLNIRNTEDIRDFGRGDIIAVAKSPSQIKSATDTTGEFSESEDIRYSSRFDVNTNPTEAQKKAGNYKMGHLRLDGYNITIENPKGSVRRGTDSKGNEWENTLNNDYGYIRGTEGVDGDHIDVYLSDNPAEGNVFVIDQVNPETREFDEHKVMYGFNSMDEAREAYLANFSEGWNGLGTITEVTKDEFRKWIDSSHRKTKPFSEHKSVKTDILDEGDIRYSVVTDPALLERLDSEPTIKVYRAMQLIDGKLYPPMSAKVDGKMREPIELGKWEQAEERPDLADEKGYFKLDKGNKTSLKARYNPYFHTSPTPLNDQFSSAQTRPELVTVEVEVPESELTSGYKAEKAKDSVGQMEWKAGVVQSKLSGTRTVILSRWDKPVRIVPDSEVADKIVEMFDGKDITMPSNVVTPSLRAELESKGIPFVETDNNGKPVETDVRFSALPTQEEIQAVRGLVSLERMNISHEYEMTMVKDMIDAERNLIKMLQKRTQTPLVQQQIKNAEERLRRNLRQMEILQEVDDALIDTTPVQPDYQSKMADMSPITKEEYFAQLFTMHLTPITQTKVVAEDGTETTIRQGGKKNGIMLTPQTLMREMGWSKSDWKGLRYIVSESEGMALDAIAEMVSEDSEVAYLFSGMDTMEIKDAIIDFLQSMGTYAEIRDYVKNERMRLAEEEAGTINAEIEYGIEQLEAQYGMPIEQYNEMTAQAYREAREKWLDEAENPEGFAKFEESKIDEYGEETIDGREESPREESSEDVGRASDEAESFEDAEAGEDLPEGDGTDHPGGSRGPGVGGSSRGDDSRAEGADTEPGLVSTDADTSRKTVDEIVESGRQKVLEANATAADVFMKRLYAINGDLAKLRRAAAAQREYDQETVQILTRLANELLENGALSDVTRGEIKRILSVIKDAVGKSDLTVSVERLMDIMIGNQLRFGRERFKEFLKIRGKRVDARGIEVRGKLDLEGQAIMEALREGISLEAEKLEERILDAEDKLFDESEVVRRNAENDLVGYNLAKQYLEDIKASETEEKDLRKELKTAETEHKEGRMTDEAWKEFKKSIHDAIRENRMQRVEAYESLLSSMAEMIQKSIKNAGQLREAEKARIEKIHHFANSDLQGKSAEAHEQKVNEFWNNPIVRLLAAPLSTFEQWMRVFGQKSADGKGYLYNHFVGGWNRANNEEYLGVKAAHDMLDAKARDVFGDKVSRWSDLFTIDKHMPTVTISMWDDGKMRDYEVTQGNLLYIYMVNKMTDGKMKLRKMGITEDDVDAIVRHMDPRFIELADWLQDEFLPYLREKYNAVHERMFGAPMAAIDNYFPIRVLANARTREVELGTDTESGRPSSITGSIIKRTKNSLALDVLGSNAFDVVLEHIEQMEHWAAFAEFNRDLNTLLSYSKFRNRVQNMSTALGAGKEAWNSFKETAEIAARVYRPKTAKIDKLVTNAVHGLTAGKISFRLWTAAKQILSMPAFLPYTNPVNFAKNLATPWESWNWAMENLPAFQKRWKSREAGNVRLRKTEADWKLWQTNAMEAMTRWGMTPNAFVDAVTCSIGARSVYETMYARYIQDGYSHEKADEKAKLDATVAFNATQQSSENAFVAAVQMDRTIVAHAATVFRNNSFGMGRELVDALRNSRDRMTRGYKEESIEYMTKQMMRDGLTPSQADRAARRLYRNSAFKDAARIATFGFMMQFLWNLGNSAVYLLFGDDDDKKKEMIKDAAIKGAFGSAEGLAFGNLVPEFIGKVAEGDLKNFNPSFTPAGSDVASLWKELNKDLVAGASDVINILMQVGFGTNPQTLVDAALAIYDAAEGDMELSKEIGIALLRIMNAPQSNIDMLVMDEINFKVDEGLDMSIEEFARRYADYKAKRNAPYTYPLYSNEGQKKAEDKYIKRFVNDAEELKRTRGNEEAKAFYGYYDDEYEVVGKTIGEYKKEVKLAAKRDQDEEKAVLKEDFRDYRGEYSYYEFKQLRSKIAKYERYQKEMQIAVDPYVKAEYEQKMLEARRAMVTLREELEYLKPWKEKELMFRQLAKDAVNPKTKEAYEQFADRAHADWEAEREEYRANHSSR